MEGVNGNGGRAASACVPNGEAGLRLLLGQVEDVLYWYRLRPQPGFLYVSPAVTRLTGYTPEEHYDDPGLVLRIVHPDDRERLEAMLRDAGPEVPSEPVVLRWVHRDGATVWTENRVTQVPGPDGELAVAGVGRDVSARRRDEAAATAHLAALSTTSSAVLMADAQGRITWVNAAFARLTGYEADQVVGRRTSLLRSGRHGQAFYEALWRTVMAGRTWQGRMWNRRRDGSLYLEEQTITPIRGADGAVSGFVAIKEQVDDEAPGAPDGDALTGLWDRRRLVRELEAAAAGGVQGALVLMDVDHLDAVNHSAGTAAGDDLLRLLARTLRECMPPGAMLARFGGDELIAVVPDAAPVAAAGMAERTLRDFSGFADPPSQDAPGASACAGVVAMGPDVTATLRAAQLALRDAQGRGRGQVGLLNGEHREWARRAAEARVARQVESALAQDRLELHLQPIVRLGGTRPVAHEALLRMRESGRLVAAGELIGPCERFGLLGQVDRFAVGRAMRMLQADPGLSLFVNLSAVGLGDDDLLDGLEQQLRAAPGVRGRLTLEITESSAVTSPDRVIGWMHRLIAQGCRFAIDDFGEGFSSFALVRRLPADVVKIDGAFVRRAYDDPEALAVVDAITRVAHALGKQVVAEWVEREEVERLLAGLGVEMGQGWHFGAPRPPDAAPPAGRAP